MNIYIRILIFIYTYFYVYIYIYIYIYIYVYTCIYRYIVRVQAGALRHWKPEIHDSPKFEETSQRQISRETQCTGGFSERKLVHA